MKKISDLIKSSGEQEIHYAYVEIGRINRRFRDSDFKYKIAVELVADLKDFYGDHIYISEELKPLVNQVRLFGGKDTPYTVDEQFSAEFIQFLKDQMYEMRYNLSGYDPEKRFPEATIK